MAYHRTTLLLALAGALAFATPSAHRAARADEAPPVWTTFTNGNIVKGVAVNEGTGDVWAATEGGVVRWDAGTGTYTKFTTADGLHDNLVRTLSVDAGRGDVWIGTNTGLDRLDRGGHWSHELTGHEINSIAVDPDSGDIWVASRQGLWSRSQADDTWAHFTASDGVPGDFVSTVWFDSLTGELWVGAWEGAIRRQADGTWSEVVLPGVAVNGFARNARTADLWVVAHSRGAYRIDAAGRTTLFTDQNSGLANFSIWSVAYDAATGDMWFATNMGVSRMAPDGSWQTFTNGEGVPCNGVFHVATNAGTGDVWFAVGDPGRATNECRPGLTRRDRAGTWQVLRTADGLAGGAADMDLDSRTGDLWVAGMGAVSRLLGNGTWASYSKSDGLAEAYPAGVRVDPSTGDAWIVVWEFGVSVRKADGSWRTYHTKNSWLVSDYVQGLAINSINGDVWFGTAEGVSRLDNTNHWKSFRIPGVPLPALVHQVEIDRRTGDVWFAIPDNQYISPGYGAYRLAPDGTWTAFTTASTDGALPTDNVHQALPDPVTGAIWFATGAGAHRLNSDGTWSHFDTTNGLPHQDVNKVTIDPDTGDAWFATLGGGAARLPHDGQWTYFTTADGLASQIVGTIVLDKQRQAVWFRTAGGISRLGPPLVTDSCAAAAAIEPGGQVASSLANASDVDLYRFEVAQPFSRVEINLTDPDNVLAVEIFRTCDGSIGTGRGRHIGTGRGRHIGGQQRLVFDAGNQTGTYYLAISARPGRGAFPLPYSLGVGISPIDPSERRSLILTHLPRVQTLFGLPADDPELVAWQQSLEALAADPNVAGILVDNVQTGTSPAVAAAYSAWLLDPADPARANAVATALRDWIWAQRQALPRLQYLVLAGDDRILPHFRLPILPEGDRADGWVSEADYLAEAGIAPASPLGGALAGDFTLTDDAYAALRPVAWGFRQQPLFVPELAVGRLVERPRDMTAAVEAFLAHDGQIDLHEALSAGYDFMEDAARATDDGLAGAGLPGARRHTLFGPDWRADDLRAALFGQRNDLAFLAVHADHQSLLVPGGERLDAAELAGAQADLAGTLALALACHAGLNVPGPGHTRSADWPAAWLGRGAAYLGSTGWAYGLAGFTAYHEALMADLARTLVTGDGTGLGDALVTAKQRYWLGHQPNHMHAKALASTVLYGLPMYRIQLETEASKPAVTAAGVAGVATGAPGATTETRLRDGTRVARQWDDAGSPAQRGEAVSGHSGLAPAAFRPAGQDRWLKTSTYPLTDMGLRRVSSPAGDYFTFGDQAPRAEAGEPVQPLFRATLGEVAFDNRVFTPRGVVLTAGRFHDVPDFSPLIESAGIMGAPRPLAAARPRFDVPGWHPALPVVLRHLDRTPGTGTILVGRTDATLLVNAGQFHAATRTERLLDELTLDEYYSASPDQEGPEPAAIHRTPDGATAHLRLTAHDPAGIDRVVVAHTGQAGRWTAVELAPGPGGTWTGSLPAGADYLVQIVDAAGNVTRVDARGQVDRPCVVCAGRPAAVYLPALGR